jgi:3-dehydroquinate synthase
LNTPLHHTDPSKLHPVCLSESLAPTLERLVSLVGSRRPVLVTERRLLEILEEPLGTLSRALGGAPAASFPGGEHRKNRRTKERLEDDLMALGAARDSVLVVVGGGVVTDLAGFAAATFMRGIPYVSVPTTLLGMVDASLGGKTAVDTPRGKNLVGAFHPPAGVFAVLDLLDTLPRRQFQCGLAECLKHGLFMDRDHFEWLAERSSRELRGDRAALRHLVERSVALKCAVVDEDPEEVTGRRNILNAGHTVGHALERLSGYRLSHGEAVASGLLWEAAAAVAQGHLDRRELPRVRKAVEGLGFPPAWRDRSPEEIFGAAGADKKNRAGQVAYVPLGTVGAPAFEPPHTADLTVDALATGLRLLGGD